MWVCFQHTISSEHLSRWKRDRTLCTVHLERRPVRRDFYSQHFSMSLAAAAAVVATTTTTALVQHPYITCIIDAAQWNTHNALLLLLSFSPSPLPPCACQRDNGRRNLPLGWPHLMHTTCLLFQLHVKWKHWYFNIFVTCALWFIFFPLLLPQQPHELSPSHLSHWSIFIPMNCLLSPIRMINGQAIFIFFPCVPRYTDVDT